MNENEMQDVVISKRPLNELPQTLTRRATGKRSIHIKRWQALSLALVALILIVLSALVVVCNSQAQALVYGPAEHRYPDDKSPADYGLSYETITLTTQDGYHLAAWYIPSQNRAAVIVLHGYGGNRASVVYIGAMLAQHGYGVMMPDLRAHGSSEGDKTSFGLYEVRDVEAAYQYLRSRPDIDPERIGVQGISMGAVVALLYTAQNPGIKAVVAESAFGSLQDEMATGVKALTGLPPFPFAPMIQWFAEQKAGFNADQVAPIKHIRAISPRPVFLMQGGADTVIPTDSGQRLYDAAGEPRELWFEPDVGHCGFGLDRAPEFEARVTAFFDRYLLEKTAESPYLFKSGN